MPNPGYSISFVYIVFLIRLICSCAAVLNINLLRTHSVCLKSGLTLIFVNYISVEKQHKQTQLKQTWNQCRHITYRHVHSLLTLTPCSHTHSHTQPCRHSGQRTDRDLCPAARSLVSPESQQHSDYTTNNRMLEQSPPCVSLLPFFCWLNFTTSFSLVSPRSGLAWSGLTRSAATRYCFITLWLRLVVCPVFALFRSKGEGKYQRDQCRHVHVGMSTRYRRQ